MRNKKNDLKVTFNLLIILLYYDILIAYRINVIIIENKINIIFKFFPYKCLEFTLKIK